MNDRETRSDYAGRCYCGAIGFVYRCATEPCEWSIRACQCRFCRAHNALSMSDPEASIEFIANDAASLNRYRFGLETADFLLCKSCGVYIGAVIESDGRHFGIINTHALWPRPEKLASAVPISYDTEDKEGRIGRREERWAPVTEYPW